VHGFTGHPQDTWTQKKASTESSGSNQFAKYQSDTCEQAANASQKSECVFWPRDLLQHTVPNSRVFTYGYDSHIKHRLTGHLNNSTVYDIAGDFLVSLEANRRQDPSRHVLFIAHSLGGIVVKETLRRSNQAPQIGLRKVCESTVGIVFFGTPHSGADPRNILHRVAEKLFKAVGIRVNEQIVNTLVPSSERLRELRDEFIPMALEREWTIHSFQEQYGLRLLGGNKVGSAAYIHFSALPRHGLI
jgi:hypothetical protein